MMPRNRAPLARRLVGLFLILSVALRIAEGSRVGCVLIESSTAEHAVDEVSHIPHQSARPNEHALGQSHCDGVMTSNASSSAPSAPTHPPLSHGGSHCDMAAQCDLTALAVAPRSVVALATRARQPIGPLHSAPREISREPIAPPPRA